MSAQKQIYRYLVIAAAVFVTGCPSHLHLEPLPVAQSTPPALLYTQVPQGATGNVSFDLSPANLEDNLERHPLPLAGISSNEERTESQRNSLFGELDWDSHFSSKSRLDRPIKFSADMHPGIKKYIDLYLNRNRNSLERCIAKNSKYLEMIEGKLKERGLPSELKWIPFLESNFQPFSRSSTENAGMWQLTPETARKYGLRITQECDERTNPELSTDAALDNLEDLYGKLDSWLLAIAAFNAGEGRILEAIRNSESHDFLKMIELQCIPQTTSRYVSAILALEHLEDNQAYYHLDLDYRD